MESNLGHVFIHGRKVVKTSEERKRGKNNHPQELILKIAPKIRKVTAAAFYPNGHLEFQTKATTSEINKRNSTKAQLF